MLDHIAFNVKNISKAVSWYKKFLKAEVEYQDETWAMLKIDGAKIALSISRYRSKRTQRWIKIYLYI